MSSLSSVASIHALTHHFYKHQFTNSVQLCKIISFVYGGPILVLLCSCHNSQADISGGNIGPILCTTLQHSGSRNSVWEYIFKICYETFTKIIFWKIENNVMQPCKVFGFVKVTDELYTSNII